MNDFSKNRVLALYKILTTYTDEQHQISMQDILLYMESEGYSCSEDSILRYIKQLRNELGVDVISSRGRNARYFIGTRLLEKEEMKLIIDSVNASNFIEKSIATQMIDKLKSTMSTYDAEDLDRTDAKYKWIGKLYPAVFTDDYKIILMSVSKFMKRNSILIDSSYEFLNSDLIENAVIVIDEFDATKDTIQSELIEKSLAMQEDYIQLFRQIYRTLNPNDFSSSMRQAMDKVEKSGNRNTFTTLMDEARKIAENYHVRLSIKTKEDLVNQRQIFLFNDGSFHTVLEEGAQYIRSSLNKEDNRIDVFFEGKDDFFKNRNKEKDIVLYSLLREINVFLLHFRLFSIEWARNYMEIINSSRSGIMDAMNLENAISTILKRLELTNKQLNRYYIGNEKEVGGILLGQFAGGIIYEVTEMACINSLHSTRIHYRRDVKKAQSIINKRWRETNGEINYLGEWHTHPNMFATPSTTDMESLSAIMDKVGNVLPVVMLLILGANNKTSLNVRKENVNYACIFDR